MQAIDKVGRTARRTIDTHVKNALAKPRLSTSIRRMTAMFHFVPDLRECITFLRHRSHSKDSSLENELAPVVSTAEKPPLQMADVELDEVDRPIPVKSDLERWNAIPSVCPLVSEMTIALSLLTVWWPQKSSSDASAQRRADSQEAPKGHVESATESENDEPMPDQREINHPSSSRLPTEQTTAMRSPTSQMKQPSPDSGSSPPRPTKKAKPAVPSSSDEESEDDRKKRGGSTGVKRGTRQPIKRGGKRF